MGTKTRLVVLSGSALLAALAAAAAFLLFLPALYAAWFRIEPTADAVQTSTAPLDVPKLSIAIAAE